MYLLTLDRRRSQTCRETTSSKLVQYRVGVTTVVVHSTNIKKTPKNQTFSFRTTLIPVIISRVVFLLFWRLGYDLDKIGGENVEQISPSTKTLSEPELYTVLTTGKILAASSIGV